MDMNFWVENFGMAGFMLAGFGAGWASCVKILVNPDRDRLQKAEAALADMRAKIEADFWNRK